MLPVALFVSLLDPYTSAELCGRCHRAIVVTWKDSAHARAMESRLFQDALELAERQGARKICLGCHAPLAVALGDLSLQRKVSWEGVTCDYCHSIREVALEGGVPRVVIEYSAAKSGPFKDSQSSAHPTVFSAVHTSSRVCAPCHEYRNAAGFPVLTTHSEWQASPYAKQGIQCQSCHMYKVAGEVVDPHVQRSRMAKINLHQMPGSHSLDQLTRTVRARLTAVREGERVRATVEIANKGAGHYVPTGSPLRKLILEVSADGDPPQRRVYERRVADHKGAQAVSEPAAFVSSARVLADSRLAPGEARTESFIFSIPSGAKTRIKANVIYYYSPTGRTESEKKVTFLSLTQIL